VNPPNVLLAGIVGSTAYGLAGPGSDVDRLGMFAAPTVAFHGLHEPRESIVSTHPDVTLHEARKYAVLALGGNPTASELMWLTDDLYETTTPLGRELIAIRGAFLSAKRIREAYLGYAMRQFRKLESRPADNRTAKHARHLRRLCTQGFELYTTGHLRIRLENPHEFLDFGEQVAGGDVDAARALIAHYEEAFATATTALPEEPDTRPVEDWLLRVRKDFL